MAGTITFGGIGSGIDTESIVSGLVQANQGTVNALKSRVSDTQSAVSSLSNISTLLSKLKTAVDALSSPTSVGSYSASSSSSAIAVSTAGNALPGRYDITVNRLAKEQRTYSDTFSAASTALGQAGTLGIAIGTNSVNVDVLATDTLDDVAAKINASGARVSAAVMFDGTNYRMQVRGLDTGQDNAVALSETGVTLGLSTPANTVQAAQNASIQIDGFNIERPTNQIAGAISGVTLALSAESATPISVQVSSDPKGLETKLQSVVDAYNSVISAVHTSAGYGTTKAADSALAGDSTLRSLTTRLSSTLSSVVGGAGSFGSLASLGLSQSRDGTLSLDTLKLENALASDPSSVSAVLAGPSGTSGVMDLLSGVINTFTQTGTGLLNTRVDNYQSRIQDLNDSVAREQDRLTRYADQLRQQFTAMDGTVAANQQLLSFLSQI